jgi:hypothetical protein
MDPIIPENLPPVIKRIRESMGVDTSEAVILNQPEANKRMWLIYNLSDGYARRSLDFLMLEVCGKTLKELLTP